MIVGMIDSVREKMGLETAANISGRSTLGQVFAEQPDLIEPALGVSTSHVLHATDAILSGPCSEQATPQEHRPDRRVVAGLLRIILWIVIAIVALVTIAFAVHLAKLPFPPRGNPLALLKAVLAGPVTIIAFLLFLLARTRKKSADHLLEYDPRPPVVFLRSFTDDDRKIRMARTGDKPVRIGFEDALSEIFCRIGPFIALGSRKDFIPRLGAARSYRDDSVWQAKAERWMRDASWILYMLGFGESLKWETAQIARYRLFNKALFLFAPDLALTRTGKKRRLRNWNNFVQTFANTELHDALDAIDQSDAIALWVGADHHIFVVRASGQVFQEYELALRIALYCKNGSRGAWSSDRTSSSTNIHCGSFGTSSAPMSVGVAA
jgi:hypothetical protein